MAAVEPTNAVARFNFRLPAEIKERVELAATASGLTVTDFAISALAASADNVLERDRERVLSRRDSEIFLKMLENPPEPNAELVNAFASHKKRVKR